MTMLYVPQYLAICFWNVNSAENQKFAYTVFTDWHSFCFYYNYNFTYIFVPLKTFRKTQFICFKAHLNLIVS